MAFNQDHLQHTGGQVTVPGFTHPCGLIAAGPARGSRAPSTFSYKTEDARATVEGAGYFNDISPAAHAGDINRVNLVDKAISALQVGDDIHIAVVTNLDTSTEAVTDYGLYLVTSTANDTVVIADTQDYVAAGGGSQDQGDVLDDLNTLGANTGADELLVGVSAGVLDWQTVAEAQETLGLEIGTDVQAYDAGLDDVSGLAVTDGNFMVGDGANWVAESGQTAMQSLGADSPITESTGTTFNVNDLDYAFTTRLLTNAAGVAVVIDSNAGTPYPISTEIYFIQGDGALTFSCPVDTLGVNSNLTVVSNGAESVMGIKKKTATTWVLFGNLVPA